MVLVFDLDGTLLNSNTVKSAIIRKFLLKHFGVHAVAEVYTLSKTRNDLLYELVPEDTELRLRLLNELSSEMDLAVSKSRTYPNTHEVLTKLRPSVDAMYLSSNTPKSSLNFILNSKGLLKYFDDFYGSPKTKFNNIKNIRDRNPASDIYVVGDGIDDLESALSVSAEFIAINDARTNKTLYPPIKIKDLAKIILDA